MIGRHPAGAGDHGFYSSRFSSARAGVRSISAANISSRSGWGKSPSAANHWVFWRSSPGIVCRQDGCGSGQDTRFAGAGIVVRASSARFRSGASAPIDLPRMVALGMDADGRTRAIPGGSRLSTVSRQGGARIRGRGGRSPPFGHRKAGKANGPSARCVDAGGIVELRPRRGQASHATARRTGHWKGRPPEMGAVARRLARDPGMRLARASACMIRGRGSCGRRRAEPGRIPAGCDRRATARSPYSRSPDFGHRRLRHGQRFPFQAAALGRAFRAPCPAPTWVGIPSGMVSFAGFFMKSSATRAGNVGDAENRPARNSVLARPLIQKGQEFLHFQLVGLPPFRHLRAPPSRPWAGCRWRNTAATRVEQTEFHPPLPHLHLRRRAPGRRCRRATAWGRVPSK